MHYSRCVSNSLHLVKMNKVKMEYTKPKYCKPFPDHRCSSSLRKLNENVIAKLKILNSQAHFNTSLSICDSCSYWNDSQATTHPFVVDYSEPGTLKNISFIIISEVLHHDTVAVQVFIAK